MTLIKSISGIRGTIGGSPEDGLNPLAIVKFVAAYATFIRKNTKVETNKIVVGRDARISGPMVKQVVLGTLTGMGFDVVDIDLATTPTTELAVAMEGACGGIILTASHNPKQWNALKLLNEKGEFLNAAEGAEVLRIAAAEDFEFADVDHLGKVIPNATYKQKHIESVLNLDLVDVEAIKAANFRVAIDCVNSVGGIVIPDLLYALGVKEIFKLHCAPHGNFSHNPEPIPENLTEISDLMGHAKADVGFVVDPDVDRLAIICENGEMFNEEYTLVAVSDYVLSHTPGNTVSNLSSSRALRDVTRAHGCEYNAAAVGEVNVVTKMKATNAVIGGEGNGGVIYPASHYGRGRFGRYRLVPDSSGKEEDEDERVEGFLSSVFHLQAKSPVNAGDRRGRYLSESKREVLSIRYYGYRRRNRSISRINGFICVRAIRNRSSVSTLRPIRWRKPRN